MKLATIVVAAALAIPAVSSFAQQSNQSLTRADVKGQLVQLEKDGYQPQADRTTYPEKTQAAEAKVAAQDGQNSYGGVADGSYASGGYRMPAHTGNGVEPVYRAH